MGLRFFYIINLAVWSCFIITPASAQENEGSTDSWHFSVAPYILFPNLDGLITVRDFESALEADPGDIFQRLNLGTMVAMQVNNRKWAITLDGIWLDFGQTGNSTTDEREIDTEIRHFTLILAGLKKVSSVLEVGLGFRMNSVKASLFAPEGLILPGVDESDRKTWVDPVLVGRLLVPTSSRWFCGIRGDVGGFGRITWQVHPFGGYEISERIQLLMAYRWIGLRLDPDDNSDGFGYDISIFGPEVGFRWTP